MKDEEMAEEIANKRCHEIMCFGHCNFSNPKHHRCGEWHREYNCALEGIKAGRPQWHDLRKEIPTENKMYLVAIKGNGLAIAYFNGKHWETKYNLGDFGHCVETVIAWCEIPTFDKE